MFLRTTRSLPSVPSLPRLGALALALALSLALFVPASPAAARDPEPTGSAAQLWSATWMGRGGAPFSRAEAVSLARSHDVVVGMRYRFKDHVAAMRQANPDVVILGYLNATFQQGGLPAGWYAHNRSGSRVRATDWPDTFLMDFSRGDVRNHISNLCDDIGDEGFDGCLLDVLGSGPLWGDYLTSTPVTNGDEWSHQRWLQWSAGLADTVRNRNPGLIVAGNGLGSGVRWFSSDREPSSLSRALPLMEAEIFVRDAHGSATFYRDEDTWRKDVDMMIESQDLGSGVMTMTKVWTGASNQQVNQWREYAYATFLLGTDGSSYFSFVPDTSAGASTETHPLYEMGLGNPTQRYRKAAGIYRRAYGNGLVLVNPTSSAVAVDLDGAYEDASGAARTGRISVPAHAGRVLVRADGGGTEPPPPPPPEDVEEIETTISSVNVDGRRLTARGEVVAPNLAGAHVAVQDPATNKWWQRSGGWGADWAALPVTLTDRTNSSARLTFTWDAPRSGQFLLMVQASGQGAARDRSPEFRTFRTQ